VEVGRRYLAALRDSDGSDHSIVEAVWFGTDENLDELPAELRWQLVMAALDECPDTDADLCHIGSCPLAELLVVSGIDERLLREREHNPKVHLLFAAMRRDLASFGVRLGFGSSDHAPARSRPRRTSSLPRAPSTADRSMPGEFQLIGYLRLLDEHGIEYLIYRTNCGLIDVIMELPGVGS
jgi:hypothetical protein